MGQKITKKEIERAENLYNEQRFDEAVVEWKKFLKRLQKPQDKFQLCGRICSALCDVGKYREALTFAGQQCELATAIGDSGFKAEAYFSIAFCNEKSCEFEKAISYCKRAQHKHPEKSAIAGKTFLCLGNAYSGMSDFRKSWTYYVRAMDEAKSTRNKVLEIQTSAKMGALFCRNSTIVKAIFVYSHLYNPQARELNNKALDLSTKADCKLGQLRCHARQKLLNDVSPDDATNEGHEGYIKKLVEEMELFCGVCGDIIGQHPERLEPLSCGHFVHARCAPHLARSTLGRAGRRRPCPACRSNSSRNPVLPLT
ncbi:hypothetical protein EGW08_001345 [Elysia chlorotica]|uniref:RING-type domain-containing protein n=1 Tax=Elysia chlorotica TaxID=188477 RepID=A0A433UAK8_ELYCH|nr:hypothetical protein EGW08_001345 [Elysia chlorotica]